MARNWKLGEPEWAWPDNVDQTGTENASASRYLPVVQTNSDGYSWVVAKVFSDEGDTDMTSDAQLIAAAPELLAALRKCVEPLEPGEGCGLPGDTYNIVCAAIAKAEGRE